MVDGVNNEIRIVDRATNAILGRVGRPGRFAGQFHVVHNVAVDAQGNVYTTEVNTGQRVQNSGECVRFLSATDQKSPVSQFFRDPRAGAPPVRPPHVSRRLASA